MAESTGAPPRTPCTDPASDACGPDRVVATSAGTAAKLGKEVGKEAVGDYLSNDGFTAEKVGEGRGRLERLQLALVGAPRERMSANPILIGAVSDGLEPRFGVESLRYSLAISTGCLGWAQRWASAFLLR